MNLDSITHTARRDHLCAFCGLTVRTGEQYVRAQSPGGAQAKKPFHIKCYQGLTAKPLEASTNFVSKGNNDGTRPV
jgi:hypothetical protein